MELPLIIGAFMILTGIFRLYLIRSGKLQFVFGFQRYFPWLFMGLGAFFIITTLLDW